jgi:hypothetical protein
MLLLSLFFIFINCDDCPHTKVYLEHGSSNNNNYYFVEKTYISTRTDLLCKIGSNDQFKQIINSQFRCEGSWCNFTGKWSNGWNCPLTEPSCYEVEHIIPSANNIPEISGCSADIFGNRVMSYKIWNRQLSNGYFSEKKDIYGNIFAEAYNAIYKCCNKTGTPVVPSNICEKTPDYVFWNLAVVLGVLICCLITLFTLKYYKDKKDINVENNKEKDDINNENNIDIKEDINLYSPHNNEETELDKLK